MSLCTSIHLLFCLLLTRVHIFVFATRDCCQFLLQDDGGEEGDDKDGVDGDDKEEGDEGDNAEEPKEKEGFESLAPEENGEEEGQELLEDEQQPQVRTGLLF